MKKVTAILFGIVAMTSAANAKTLVAYYSQTGNTAAVADIIKNATGADVFEIKTADANHYPTEYSPLTQVAQQEIRDGKFPDIAAVPDVSAYDTVFVGTPCWWGTMAGPVHTFLTTVDLAGKTVVPFNTHGGSGAGTVHTDIEKLTPDSAHKSGIAISGAAARDAGTDVDAWLTRIGAK